MPIDAYSLCPGGTGKKIKFCCPDFVAELQKIGRMLEGDQQLACSKHIDQLLQKTPDKACLLAIKAALLRSTDQFEEAVVNAAHFLEKHPENTTALAESAMITAAEEGGQAAIGLIHRALEIADGEISDRLYEAMQVVSDVLLHEGQWLAGRALLRLQMAIARDDERPTAKLFALNQSPEVPVLFKDAPIFANCPPDAPWKTRFDEAMAPAQAGKWQTAADRLAALVEEVGDWPEIWRNLAMLRGWLGDNSGFIETLQKYAALDVPLEDAVEAEALAMLSADDPLGDQCEMLSLTWTVKDADQLETTLLAEPRTIRIPFDPATFSDADNPPPKAAFLLLDRQQGEEADDVTPQTLSRVLGQAMFYGRQTDREARLEVIGVVGADVEALKTLLGEMAGESLEAAVEQTTMGHVSASRELLHNKWRPPKKTTREQFDKLVAEYRRYALLERWPELKLGALGGKTPCEAAGEEASRVKVMAAIMVLDCWLERMPGGFDFNELRKELELPTLDPIDPGEVEIDDLPAVRLFRVEVEKASDEALLLVYRHARAFATAKALRKFALALIERESLAGREERLQAYSILARMEEDPQRAIEYVTRGREAGLAAGQSCAAWDLLELSFRFEQGDGNEVQELLNHLQNRHMEEPGVAESLMRLLVRYGVLRPDGMPVPPPPMYHEPILAAADQGMPGQPAPGRIWTPGSDQPGGEKKLWTPD
ncbi:MAG TPA: hypothetical protein VMY42_27955 [Thermoguttaceae bacterium]|nr:hypothetical protein [Thermoguttaceae bacterium]